MTPLRVLIIEDYQDDVLLVLRELEAHGYAPVHERVDTEAAFRDALRSRWDIILSDFHLPRFSALTALRILQEKGLDIPFIILSGAASESTVLEVVKAGAGDYLMKSNLTRLAAAVEREVREAAGRRERRRLEEQFRHAQKMEAVGRLAGGVAHDFNNLLTVITGYSDLLLANGGLDEGQSTALEEIRKAAERGGALTHQLLAFSRRQPLEPRTIQFNDLIVNMEKMLRRLIGEDIELITLPAARRGAVRTDRGQLEQVIMNLVVNARDAMPGGGKLALETSEAEVDPETAAALGVAPGAFLVLAISDSGSGMDEATRSHLFEPFFTTKAPGKGTGLGLATAYGIVRQSGGSITVESEVGRGTMIRIYLPLIAESGEAEPAETAAAGPLLEGSETILVVEDEARVRKLICEVLSVKGYRILEATRGEEALRVCASTPHRVDLALVDVVMPEMSGPEVVRRLLSLRPSLRVLYMSGYTDEAIVHHGILTSGSAFLQKPFLPAVLVRKVREVLNAAGQLSAEQ